MSKAYLFGKIPIDLDASLGTESQRFKLGVALMAPTAPIMLVNAAIAFVLSEGVPYVLGKLLGAVTGDDE